MNPNFFAAFIMTYERPLILRNTIAKILEQSLPPSKILVVDNSLSNSTKLFIEKLNNPSIEYLSVGYNSGPSVASQMGLRKLTNEGYEWIYWGDDDNPPEFKDAFEMLLKLGDEKLRSGMKVGAVGAVGQYFSPKKGKIVRVKDKELQMAESLNVDFIAGGQTMIVHSLVVKENIFSQEKLFFGFEELDFCLKVKSHGFSLIVLCDLFIRSRKLHGKLNFMSGNYSKINLQDIYRVYYSVRNLCFILWGNNLYWAFLFHVGKSLLKSIYGFKYGMQYGFLNFTMIFKGLFHFVCNRGGKLIA